MKKLAVIVCAAGSGSRFGEGRKKPFIDVAGRAAFVRSIDFFANRDDIKQIILAISPDDEEMVKIKWGANLSFSGAKLCFGGTERFETVAKALEMVRDDIELIAVHDAVRCCLQDDWVDEVIAQAGKTGAAILACPVVATVKKVVDGKITETVDRTGLYEAQTPQVFDAALLREAYSRLGKMGEIDKSKISDDAALVEAMGKDVAIVESDHSNIKITRKSDVAIAEAIIKSRGKPKPKGPVGPYSEAQW